jgi:molecular chaperone GrpE (heat shock protein)
MTGDAGRSAPSPGRALGLGRAFDLAAELDDRDRVHREERRALLLNLLEVMDSFDRLLSAPPASPGAAEDDRETVRLIAKQLEGVLWRTGMVQIGQVGEPLDPRRHEVAGQRPRAGGPANRVTEVVRRGYELDGRLLRPARVIVTTDTLEGAP